MTEVGSLSAAAAHELGTPLNTIFLVLNDLLKEKKLTEDKNIVKDIILLKSQAERCKEILQRFSKNPLKLKDKFLEKVKISDLIKINFDKFTNSDDMSTYVCFTKEQAINLVHKFGRRGARYPGVREQTSWLASFSRIPKIYVHNLEDFFDINPCP